MKITKPYVIAMFMEDDVKILGNYNTYEEADSKYDYFCEKYPYACIDIENVCNL